MASPVPNWCSMVDTFLNGQPCRNLGDAQIFQIPIRSKYLVVPIPLGMFSLRVPVHCGNATSVPSKSLTSHASLTHPFKLVKVVVCCIASCLTAEFSNIMAHLCTNNSWPCRDVISMTVKCHLRDIESVEPLSITPLHGRRKEWEARHSQSSRRRLCPGHVWQIQLEFLEIEGLCVILKCQNRRIPQI